MQQVTKTEIARQGQNRPPVFSGKSDIFIRSEADFNDSSAWDYMAKKQLPKYRLPKWSVPCSLEAMDRWADRLGMDENQYQKLFGCSFQEFMELNPTWPLRAWIGTVMEAA